MVLHRPFSVVFVIVSLEVHEFGCMTLFYLAYIISVYFFLFLSTTFILAIFSIVSLLDFDAYAQSDYQKIASLFLHPHGLWFSSLIPLIGWPKSPNTCDPGVLMLITLFCLWLSSQVEALDFLRPGNFGNPGRLDLL